MKAKPVDTTISGDPKKIEEMTEYLLQTLAVYLEQNPETKVVDVFMTAHNFHKNLVRNIALRWEKEIGAPYQKTIRVADMTFRRAMKEIWRATP